jgi:hypothetical protein
MAPDEEVTDADLGGEPSLPLASTSIFASPLRVHFASLNYRLVTSGQLPRLSASVLSYSRLLRTGGQRVASSLCRCKSRFDQRR